MLRVAPAKQISLVCNNNNERKNFQNFSTAEEEEKDFAQTSRSIGHHPFSVL